ncbi:MAG: radical SAM protein [Clostridia bacterium]|nr:radical SAM protein [Clostridia bacterium]
MEKIKNQQNKHQPNMHSNQKNSIDIPIDFGILLKNFSKEKQYTIPIFIPHVGCKNECVFCNQKKISGQTKIPDKNDIKDTIEKYIEKFKYDRKIQVAFFGGSFTGLNISKQIDYLKSAYGYVKNKKVESIRLSTRPDYISVRTLKLLKKYGVKSIEIGVQSMSNDVLTVSKRGHQRTDVIRAARLIKLFGFDLGFQIMVGLPKSTEKTEIDTIKTLLLLKPKELRVYPVYVIEQSELFDMYKEGEYEPLSLDDAIDRGFYIVNECKNSDVKIIKLGLQSTDEITQNNEKIVGPVCDNYAEYVIAKLLLEEIDLKIKEVLSKNENVNKVNFIVSKDIPISLVVGPKKVNVDYIKKKYNVEFKVKNTENR